MKAKVSGTVTLGGPDALNIFVLVKKGQPIGVVRLAGRLDGREVAIDVSAEDAAAMGQGFIAAAFAAKGIPVPGVELDTPPPREGAPVLVLRPDGKG